MLKEFFIAVTLFSNIESLAFKSGSGIYMRLVSLLKHASSRSSGLLVAANTNTFLSELLFTPSNYTRNSVFNRREASCSLPPLVPIIESISSIKITLGSLSYARAKRVRTSFSLSPIHLEVSVTALQEKKVDLHSVAIAFASRVFPLPGGP